MGEGVLVISLEYSVCCSLGGSSKHLVVGMGRVMRAVQGRGLPGSSSQRNGTETEVWSGGVSIPEGLGDSLGGTEDSESLGVEIASVSASDPMTLFL